MRIFRTLTIAVVVSALSIVSYQAKAADESQTIIQIISDWQSKHPGGVGDKTVAFGFSDYGWNANTGASYMWANTPNGNTICKSLSDCINQQDIQADLLLPFCNDGYTTNCIESVSAIDTAGKTVAASAHQYIPANQSQAFIGSVENRLPYGSTTSIVTFPGLSGDAGKVPYAVSVGFLAHFSTDGASSPIVNFSNLFTPRIIATIAPIRIQSGKYSSRTVESTNVGERKQVDYEKITSHGECVVVDTNLCGIPISFPEGVAFSLALKLNTPNLSWWHGRLQKASMHFSSLEKESTEIVFSGYPSKVPYVQVETQFQNISEDVAKYWFAADNNNYGTSLYPPIFQVIASNFGSTMMKAFNDMSPYMSGHAQSMPGYWTVRTIATNANSTSLPSSRVSTCTDKVATTSTVPVGYINTNATAYITGAPTYNTDLQSLDYTVAAPHYEQDSKVFNGFYSLDIAESAAKCIFGVDLANAKSTISVTSIEGANKFVSVSSGSKNGFYNFTASGFTFSSPTIHVKLSKSTTPKLKSITCIKGKITKKVNGVNPTCPKGFKAK